MKFLDTQAVIGTAIFLFASSCESKHAHSVNHLNILANRHQNKRTHTSSVCAEGLDGLHKRSTCEFPSGAGLVAVTPGAKNAGWAMSPDQECTPDSFCPYACPSGQVMAQWNPQAKNYPDPKSMDGGLYCNKKGEIVKPFDDKPYCVPGTNTVGAQNKCGKTVSFCQTVLPGNEAMIIPTQVDSWTQLAVPGSDYWLSTAAHYYVNFPGTGVGDACIWGDGVKPLGNWAPYVAGANTLADGTTFSMISWNPIFLESWHAKTIPTFGVKIDCVSGDCIGTPCSIDPSKGGVGKVDSATSASGAGGANFCVVTVPKGGKANVVIFPIGKQEEEAEPTKTKESTTTAQLTSTTTTEKPTTTSSPPTTTKVSTTKKMVVVSSSTVEEEESTSSTETSDTEFSAPTGFMPHILFQKPDNASTTASATKVVSKTATLSATAEPASSTTKASSANSVQGSMFSFLVVFAAAAYIL